MQCTPALICTQAANVTGGIRGSILCTPKAEAGQASRRGRKADGTGHLQDWAACPISKGLDAQQFDLLCALASWAFISAQNCDQS